jgi:outer membrane protein
MRTVSSMLLPVAFIAATLAATPASADTKIAVVRTQVILRDAPQTKSASQKMKSEFEKREKDLYDEGKRLQDDIEKFQREADTMSAPQRASTDKELNSRKQQFDLRQRHLSEEAQSRNQELQRDLFDTVHGAIEAVAKEKQIDLVVPDPLYFAATLDITDEVIKRLATLEPAPADDKKKKKK